MISYEKTARAFKSSTIAIAVLNILTFVLGLWGLLGIVSIQHRSLLMTMDELLMLSTILFGCTFYSIRKRYFQNKKILTGLL
ncbi:hypothetical protein LGW36_09420, partial [Streptococcus mutans]|nr:hypothetical protein [Streptococcus mutans]